LPRNQQIHPTRAEQIHHVLTVRVQVEQAEKIQLGKAEQSRQHMVKFLQDSHQTIWVIMSVNDDPILAYKSYDEAVHGCYDLLKVKDPEMVENAHILNPYESGQPFDWSNKEVIKDIAKLCDDFIEVPLF
jgi:predicted thioredoxin/glutaredoxin